MQVQESRSKKELFFEVRGISKSFSGTQALKNVSLNVRAGQVHAVIGENGAGKSTLMNIICGKLQPDTGELARDGKVLNFRSPMDAHRAGIAIAPQELNLCPQLSVAENIVLGNQLTAGVAIDRRATRRVAEEHLAEIDDRIDPRIKVGELSAAAQQLVQIARATATHADILIFDEPTAALTDREAKSLFGFISRFRERGGAIFYISHRLDEILEYGDRISVLRDGAYITELDPRRTNKDEMVRHMAGRQFTKADLRSGVKGTKADEIILKVQGLSRKREFDNVSFRYPAASEVSLASLESTARPAPERAGDSWVLHQVSFCAPAGKLTALVGPARVKDLIFTARLVGAEEAASVGLLHEVVEDLPALQKRSEELAVLIAGNAPLTLSATKQALARLQRRLSREEGEDLILQCYMSQDFREGLDAFLNKRPPQWKGR